MLLKVVAIIELLIRVIFERSQVVWARNLRRIRSLMKLTTKKHWWWGRWEVCGLMMSLMMMMKTTTMLMMIMLVVVMMMVVVVNEVEWFLLMQDIDSTMLVNSFLQRKWYLLRVMFASSPGHKASLEGGCLHLEIDTNVYSWHDGQQVVLTNNSVIIIMYHNHHLV